jgi:AraC-like DNA-binding protein
MGRISRRELAHVSPLPDAVWEDGPERSAELTPLYVQRYVGPRLGPDEGSHPYPEMTYCMSGRGVLVAGASVALRPHRAILVGAGLSHRERAASDLETVWIGLAGSLADRLPVARILLLDDPALTATVERLWEQSQPFSAGGGAECDALTRLVLARVLRGAQESPAPDLVGRALSMMHERLGRPISVGHLAAALGCSEGYLHRTFKSRTGETPVGCLTRLRLERALTLMRQTRLSVKQIARRVGYRDPLYFSRVFRRHYGRPPAQAARAARGRSRGSISL